MDQDKDKLKVDVGVAMGFFPKKMQRKHKNLEKSIKPLDRQNLF